MQIMYLPGADSMHILIIFSFLLFWQGYCTNKSGIISKLTIVTRYCSNNLCLHIYMCKKKTIKTYKIKNMVSQFLFVNLTCHYKKL